MNSSLYVTVLALLLLLIGSSLSGCSTMPSGHYVEIKSPRTSWEELSKRYQIPVWRLKMHNPQLDLSQGAWAFIPYSTGGLLESLGQYGLGNAEDPRLSFQNGRFLWPVPSSKRISSSFGWRNRRLHEGIDIPAASGTHIWAAADGIVVYSGNGLSGYGNLTVIDHGQGIFTVYAHAKKNLTRLGQRVYRGEVIALVGSTGRSSGPHLHFEVRRQGKAYNPVAFLQQN
ncbi:MAG: M23 family metallopeptidase [Bacteriovoracaceae bacterium]|nr:M23 family metallopeptidase [Bacteriovoracaceae bacterium]